ncbi:MAG: lipopolysaccharide transport system permease protein [Verrucomicrobiales bacterium]|jgi:lipopolysaccharide transport system permease protein
METVSASETVIRPNRSWWGIDWREFAEYRDLLWLLVRRDFVAKYKQTVLGPLWFILQPLLTTLVFTVVFGNFAEIPTDGAPKVLFYLCGMLGWNYFSLTFTATAGTFTSNANLFGKVYFPRLILPTATAIGNLFALLLNLGVFAAFWGYYHFFTDDLSSQPGFIGRLALVPLLILQTAGVSLGCGLWMAALTAKYRDLTHMTGFMIQIWLYATPVIYPLSIVSGKWQTVAALNPMTCVVEGFRIALLGTGNLPPHMIAISTTVTLALLLSAILAFRRTERTFIDTV